MSEQLPPHPRRTSRFGDPALVFPEFVAKQNVLEKVQEEEGEGEDGSSYGKGSFDLSSSKFEFHEKTSSLKLSSFKEEEEIEQSSYSGYYNKKRECYGCFRKCCACTCMLLSMVLIIVLLAGLSVNSSIKSRLPNVFVVNVKFTKLDFVGSLSTNVMLNANLSTVLELSNENDKTMLYYSSMRGVVSSENINLGQKKLPGFSQNPGNITYLKIDTKRRKSKVNDVDATLLRNKEKKLEALFNVVLSGKLGFDWLGFKIGLPIVIACGDVKQSDVVNGLKPKCDVQISSH
ncbi:unnamed protein product [Cochlearia groenlandica]